MKKQGFDIGIYRVLLSGLQAFRINDGVECVKSMNVYRQLFHTTVLRIWTI